MPDQNGYLRSLDDAKQLLEQAEALLGDVACFTGDFISDAKLDIPPKRTSKELYDEARGLLDKIVPQVLHSYWHVYTADDVKRFTSRINLLLLGDDYAKLKDL